MQTKTNVFTNKITRNAIFYTLFILIIYRLGSYVVTPGVDAKILADATSANIDAVLGLSTLFDFFGGGSITRLSLFALGVSPYISASIIIQLLENELVPAMNEWKHQGVDGQNKRTMYTKYLSILLAFIQALAIPITLSLSGLIGTAINDSMLTYLLIALFMTTGTTIMIWLSDRITEKGIGNGMSVMIVAGILSQLPKQFITTGIYLKGLINDGIDYNFPTHLGIWSVILVILLIVVGVIVAYSLAYRKVQINYVRTGRGTVRKNSYIPVKLNPAGVIPVIFVQPIFIALNMLITWMTNSMSIFTNDGAIGGIEAFIRSLFNLYVTGFNAIIPFTLYFVIIVAFSVFYSYIQMNPTNMAESLEKQSAYVIGIRPGEDTELHLTDVILTTSFWGGIILGLVSVLPLIIDVIVGNANLRVSLLGTGLIIVVSVLVQTYRTMTNKIESKKYRRLLGDM